jgi:O-antigen/teichoic acid export membrane protein
MADDLGGTALAKGGILRRAIRNAGLLLTGKGAAGVMQLATFALLARDLGLSNFGYFSIVLAQTQLLIAISTFQSNQAVIRYGVAHLHNRDRTAFQSLIIAATALDLLAAGVATAAALIMAPLLGRWEQWPTHVVHAAQWLALLPLANAIATPKGILRLFGRFDLLARHVTITPAVRLLGVILISGLDRNVLSYALVWVAAGWIGGIVAIYLGWREARRSGLLGGLLNGPVQPNRDNPGIWTFSLLSNIHSTLAALPGHLATYVVGLTLGATPAGLMKVAQEIGTGLAKPIDLLNQAVYPDIARVAAAGQWRRLRKLVAKAGGSAAAVSAIITVALVVAGRPLIAAIFGEAFASAYELLILVSLATTLTVVVCAVDPALYAMGRPSRPLATSLISNVIFLATLLFALPRVGVIAGGLAYIAAALATLLLSAAWLRLSLKRASAEPIRPAGPGWASTHHIVP